MKKISSRYITLLLIPFFIFAIFPTYAKACSCIPPQPPQESLAQSAAVFSGTVTHIEQSALSRDQKISFDVRTVWKGADQKTLSLTTPGDSAACGYSFSEGGAYLVYASETEDKNLAVYLCGRTALLENATEDLEILGAGNSPTNGTKASEDKTSKTSALMVGGVALAGIILIVVAYRLTPQKKN